MPRRRILVFTAAWVVTFASACVESAAPAPRAPVDLEGPASNLQAGASSGRPRDPWSLPPSAFEQRSRADVVGGVFLTGLGIGGLAFGTTFYTMATRSCAEADFFLPDKNSIGGASGTASNARLDCSDTITRTGAMTAAIAGLAFVAVGVPLWVHGATKVPKGDGAGESARAEVIVTSGSASIRWSF